MRVQKNYLITILYTIKSPSGEVVEYSDEDDPLEYLHGHGLMLPGLEAALEGCEVGDAVNVFLEPEDGFGQRDEEKIVELERSDFGSEMELEPGVEFDVEDSDGEGIITILSVEGDKVIADSNHPLAGIRLNVEARVLDIKKAEDWEIKGWKHHNH